MKKTKKEQESFWLDKTVLVTGITGFVGSALASRLIEEGANVVGLVRDDVPNSNFHLKKLTRKITVVRGYLEDYELLERAINEYGVEYVYHLGAQAIVGVANRSPLSTFHSNIQGTWNLMEACRGKKSVRGIIVASSDKAYGTHKKLPYKESFPLLPEYPYDVSKACADLITQCYFKTYQLPVVITRFANIYGPGDFNFSRIVPDTIRSVIAGKNPIIRSDGSPERDYLYIEDVVDLYLLLGREIEKTRGEIFNAGHKKPVSVLNLVKTILNLAGRKGLKPVITGKGNPHGEIDRQWLDGAKVEKVLGWKPKFDLENGLKKTLDWYLNQSL